MGAVKNLAETIILKGQYAKADLPECSEQMPAEGEGTIRMTLRRRIRPWIWVRENTDRLRPFSHYRAARHSAPRQAPGISCRFLPAEPAMEHPPMIPGHSVCGCTSAMGRTCRADWSGNLNEFARD